MAKKAPPKRKAAPVKKAPPFAKKSSKAAKMKPKPKIPALGGGMMGLGGSGAQGMFP